MPRPTLSVNKSLARAIRNSFGFNDKTLGPFLKSIGITKNQWYLDNIQNQITKDLVWI